MTKTKDLRVAVIGAGPGGILAAIKLKERGITNISVFEKADSMGGTWRENIYPGVACDVPSHSYRYSFAPNTDWSRQFAPGSEIREYVAKVADSFGVESYIQYNEEVLSAEFEDDAWHVVTTSGDKGYFHIIISAVGVLHHPVYPDIKGLESFGGASVHTARWDDTLDYSGKRVGIIGAGSTGTQLASAIVDDVAHLNIFQRTAQWIMPAENFDIAEDKKAEYRNDPQLMQAEYDQIADKMNNTFASAIVGENKEIHATITHICTEHLGTVKDPELRKKLTPDYKLGCKRLVASGVYYDDIQKPNVTLTVDDIDSVTENGVLTKDGTLHEMDILILATGFDPFKTIQPIQIEGLNGKTIDEIWEDGCFGYMTTTIPSLPNFFMLGGPSSPIGNFSYLLTAEIQIGYILQLVDRLTEGDVKAISPCPELTKSFNEELKSKMSSTVWASGCSSWYLDGKGNIASWPWSFEKFTSDLSEPNWDSFVLS